MDRRSERAGLRSGSRGVRVPGRSGVRVDSRSCRRAGRGDSGAVGAGRNWSGVRRSVGSGRGPWERRGSEEPGMDRRSERAGLRSGSRGVRVPGRSGVRVDSRSCRRAGRGDSGAVGAGRNWSGVRRSVGSGRGPWERRGSGEAGMDRRSERAGLRSGSRGVRVPGRSGVRIDSPSVRRAGRPPAAGRSERNGGGSSTWGRNRREFESGRSWGRGADGAGGRSGGDSGRPRSGVAGRRAVDRAGVRVGSTVGRGSEPRSRREVREEGGRP